MGVLEHYTIIWCFSHRKWMIQLPMQLTMIQMYTEKTVFLYWLWPFLSFLRMGMDLPFFTLPCLLLSLAFVVILLAKPNNSNESIAQLSTSLIQLKDKKPGKSPCLFSIWMDCPFLANPSIVSDQRKEFINISSILAKERWTWSGAQANQNEKKKW